MKVSLRTPVAFSSPAQRGIAAGFGLIVLALLWHPASPAHFLMQVLSSPFESLFKVDGRLAAVLFWLGLALIAWNLMRLFRHGSRLKVRKPAPEVSGPIRAAENVDGGGWFV